MDLTIEDEHWLVIRTYEMAGNVGSGVAIGTILILISGRQPGILSILKKDSTVPTGAPG